jgi:hypothetical protein
MHPSKCTNQCSDKVKEGSTKVGVFLEGTTLTYLEKNYVAKKQNPDMKC